MLALSRKKDEAVIINDDREITIIEIKGDQVKIGISAPKSVPIYRKEVYMQIQNANKEAAQSVDIKNIKEISQGLRVIGAGAAADHDGVFLRTLGSKQRNAREVQHLKDIGVAHLILDREAEEVELLHGILGFQGEKGNVFFSHDLVKIGPGRINALTPDIVTLVEHIIKNLDA